MTDNTNALQTLKEGGIESVLIVDDGYDLAPQPNDIDHDIWTKFLVEVTDQDADVLDEIYPGYKALDEREMFSNAAFIASLWNEKDQLRPELQEALFRNYSDDLQQDQGFLETLTSALEDIGIEPATAGRSFEEPAAEADLIIIDLFLGSAQRPEDREASVKKLSNIIAQRRSAPPAVLLMSRRAGLSSAAERFRDDTKLFASSFRFIPKQSLAKPGRLSLELVGLAEQLKASRKLAAFALSWQNGLADAATKAMKDFRRLDLEDWAQIGELSLSAEGMKLGSYILDLFDRVLLHELESQREIVNAAQPLNDLIGEDFPPNNVTGAPHTLALAEKALFQSKARVMLDTGRDSPVGFGDIIGLKHGQSPSKNTIFHGTKDTVFVVMTPACDLQRLNDGTDRIVLMAGQCLKAEPNSIKPVSSKPRTPILSTPHGEKFVVEWNVKHLETLNSKRVRNLISGDNCKAEIVGRLRETASVSLQQAMLASLGRVGVSMPPTPSFPVHVEVHYGNPDGDLVALPIDADAPLQGICWIGRDNNKALARIPFHREWQASFIDAIQELEDQAIATQGRTELQKARKIEYQHALFRRGLLIDLKAKGLQVAKLELATGSQKFARALFDPPLELDIDKSIVKKAGLVFKLFSETP